MAVVTQEQLFKMLTQLQQELGTIHWKMQDISCQIKAVQLHSEGMVQDPQKHPQNARSARYAARTH
jgi:hypothetical protein